MNHDQVLARSVENDMENARVSRFVATPPIFVTKTVAPPPPVVVPTEPRYCSVGVGWSAVASDGGDEPFAYEMQYSPIDPMTNDPVLALCTRVLLTSPSFAVAHPHP